MACLIPKAEEPHSPPAAPPSSLLHLLSHRTEYLPRLPQYEVTNRSSFIGVLYKLPPELLDMVLKRLDLQSFSRLCCVSSGFRNLIISRPAYKGLLGHVPEAVAILSQARLLNLHPAELLHEVLHSDRCAFCPQRGPCLSLLTCERCCHKCLLENPSLAVISVENACKYFGLFPEHVDRLPTLRPWETLSEVVSTRWKPKMYPIVNARMAIDRGIYVHGSAERLAWILITRFKDGKTIMNGSYYLKGLLSKPRWKHVFSVPQGFRPTDGPSGCYARASIPFPSLKELSNSERTPLCKLCIRLFPPGLRYLKVNPEVLKKLDRQASQGAMWQQQLQMVLREEQLQARRLKAVLQKNR